MALNYIFLRQGVSVRHLGAVVGGQMDMVELRHEMCKLSVRFWLPILKYCIAFKECISLS